MCSQFHDVKSVILLCCVEGDARMRPTCNPIRYLKDTVNGIERFWNMEFPSLWDTGYIQNEKSIDLSQSSILLLRKFTPISAHALNLVSLWFRSFGWFMP